MFIEHRTYAIKPGQLGPYLDDYGKHGWAAHSAHTPCVGHYYTEAGALFRVVSMWRYESFEDRLHKRATLGTDPQWREVMTRISPLVTDIQSNLLMPSPFWKETAMHDDYKKLYAAIDTMNMNGFLDGLTDDVRVTFGNHPSAVGKEQVKGAIGAFWASIGALKHNFVNVYNDGPNQTLEARIDYTRKDGKVVSVPCSTLLTWRDRKVASMRIYIDVAPVYAP